MSQAKKQYVIVFWNSWWAEEFAFGPFTSKVKAAKAMAALYRSDWYRGKGYGKADCMLRVAELEDLPD